tara:strand:- start:1700 stop:1942 length:243 start_codon:yes stop_codon:yes gene_type:complete
MTGTVTISLKDYKELENAQGNATTMNERTHQAAKELEVFLSFLCTRESITPYIEEFNKQSKRSQIILDGGRAKIKVNEEA